MFKHERFLVIWDDVDDEGIPHTQTKYFHDDIEAELFFKELKEMSKTHLIQRIEMHSEYFE